MSLGFLRVMFCFEEGLMFPGNDSLMVFRQLRDALPLELIAIHQIIF